jgi:hypothetical protein
MPGLWLISTTETQAQLAKEGPQIRAVLAMVERLGQPRK